MSTKPNSFPSSGIENALFLITLGMGNFFFFQCDLLTPILETFVRYGLSLQIPPTYFSVLVFIISSWQGISQWPKTQCAIGMQWPFLFSQFVNCNMFFLVDCLDLFCIVH